MLKRIPPTKKAILFLLALVFFTNKLNAQNSISNSPSYLEHIQTIDLDSLKLPHPNVDIHFINNWLCMADFSDQNIKCFDDNGTVQRKIGRRGRGPGEFNQLAFIDVNEANSRLVALDISKRVSIFDLGGNYISSFIISKPHHSFDITYLKNKDEYIAIGGLPFSSSNYEIEENKGFVNLYDLDGQYKKSFSSTVKLSEEKKILQAINMDVIVKSNSNGEVLAAQPLEYKLIQYNVETRDSEILISKVPDYVKIVDEAIPPAAVSKRKIDDFWFAEDRHILNSFFSSSFGYVMKVKTFQPSMYSLDIYDSNGDPIVLNITTDMNLRAVKDGKFYFTTFSKDSNSYQIKVYDFNFALKN